MSMRTSVLPCVYLDESNFEEVMPRTVPRLAFARLADGEATYTNRGIGITYVLSGEETYRINQRLFRVRAGQYLLVNDGQKVRCQVKGERPMEGLSINLNSSLLKQVAEDLQLSPSEQKTCHFMLRNGQTDICEHVYEAHGSPLGAYLEALSQRLRRRETPLSEAEQETISRELARRLILAQVKVFRQVNRLNSAKLSTRVELYRRLCEAKTYIHQNLDSPLELDTLAQVACLSKFHFIRLFKDVYGQTPRQYLIAKRLDRASKLLIHSSLTFHEICQEVGLKDSSSFGRLFKRSFGATPHLYRQMHARA
ncbi:MAG: AraC family transcriptional regulator [Bacteroidetes bacterium]|nr:MAG: AraC family transcriptional regulator [Bacteroidota bacterium]